MKTEITVTENEDEELPEEFADQWNTMLAMQLRIDLLMMKRAPSPDAWLEEFFAQIKPEVLRHFYNRFPPEEIN